MSRVRWINRFSLLMHLVGESFPYVALLSASFVSYFLKQFPRPALFQPDQKVACLVVFSIMLGGQEEFQRTDSVNLCTSSPSSDEEGVAGSVVSKDPTIDGGLTAWLQVVGAFCLFFANW